MTENQDLCTWLPAFAADDLNQADRAKFEDHLAECSQCRQEWEELSPALVEIRRTGASALPANGLERLKRAQSRSAVSTKKRRPTFRYAAAAAVALLFFGSGFWSGRNSADQPLTAVLRLPFESHQIGNLPDLSRPSFTVALAESIPVAITNPGVGHR
jgi:anti-sigma factor RsiW